MGKMSELDGQRQQIEELKEKDKSYTSLVIPDTDIPTTGLAHRSIKVPVYFHFDEEIGYILDTDDMEKDFQEKMEELQEDINETNYARNEHLVTKHEGS